MDAQAHFEIYFEMLVWTFRERGKETRVKTSLVVGTLGKGDLSQRSWGQAQVEVSSLDKSIPTFTSVETGLIK